MKKNSYRLYMIPFIVATLAPIVNTIQMLPQLHKTYTTKNVRDVSLSTLVLILLTNLLWLLHGYFIVDASLLIGGIVSMIINISLLILYFFYSIRNRL